MDSLTRKKLLLNFFCFAILLVYTVLGGLLLLYFEHDEAIAERKSLLELKRLCIRSTLFRLIKIVNFKQFYIHFEASEVEELEFVDSLGRYRQKLFARH